MQKTIFLWNHRAPYSDESAEQAQPSVRAFPVEGANGAVVVCPGGGYEVKCSDYEGDDVAVMLNRAGISAYVLDYRVAPCHHLAPLTDAQRAIRLVRSLGYKKVGILGFSAGGNLAVAAGTHYDAGNPAAEDAIERFSCRPDVMVPCYAVVSLVSYTHYGSARNLLGEHVDDYGMRKYFSGELNVTSDTPETFLWHTASDRCVPVENSLMLAKSLADNQVKFEMHVYPNGDHGLGLAGDMPDVATWAGHLTEWLKARGFAKAFQ